MADLSTLKDRLLSLHTTTSEQGIRDAATTNKGSLIIHTDPKNNSYHSAYILDNFIASGYGARTEADRDNLTYVANSYTGFAKQTDIDTLYNNQEKLQYNNKYKNMVVLATMGPNLDNVDNKEYGGDIIYQPMNPGKGDLYYNTSTGTIIYVNDDFSEEDLGTPQNDKVYCNAVSKKLYIWKNNNWVKVGETIDNFKTKTNNSINDLYNKKADKTYVETLLEQKVDTDVVDNLDNKVTDLYNKKVDKTYIETTLGQKVDKSDVEILLEQKANKDDVEAIPVVLNSMGYTVDNEGNDIEDGGADINYAPEIGDIYYKESDGHIYKQISETEKTDLGTPKPNTIYCNDMTKRLYIYRNNKWIRVGEVNIDLTALTNTVNNKADKINRNQIITAQILNAVDRIDIYNSNIDAPEDLRGESASIKFSGNRIIDENNPDNIIYDYMLEFSDSDGGGAIQMKFSEGSIQEVAFKSDLENIKTINDTHSLYVDKEYIDSNGTNIFIKDDFKYIITDPITINDTVSFGKNSVLEFTKNGRINGNGTLVFNNSEIIADKHQIFDTNIKFNGLLINDAFYPEWFGAVGDGKTDDWLPIQTSIDNVGHVPVVLTAEKYLVKKTVTIAEPFANEGVNKYYEYANSVGSKWNDRQSFYVKHDIIGDASLEDAVIRIGSNQSYLTIDGALVVRNPSDKAIGISCAGHTYTKGDSTTGYDHIFTGDLGASPHIKVNTIIKGNDGFTYYTGTTFNNATATTNYGLGKGTAILYGGGSGCGVDVKIIHGFRNGIWIAMSNGGTFNIGRCACINDILIDGASYLWGAGVTRNEIRVCTHQMNKAWYWVANADEPISIFRIKGNATVNIPTVEVANNRFILDHDNATYSYNHIFFKDGNNAMTGNKLEASYTLTGNYSGNSYGWQPIKIVTPTKGSRTNNANSFYNFINWDYATINITDGYNCEVGPVVIDSNIHSNCYRYGNAASDIPTRFLCEKIYFTHPTTPEMDTTQDCIKIIVPHYSQLSRIHIYDSSVPDSIPEDSAIALGHIYIDKNASNLTGCPKYPVKGYENGEIKDLGYYIDTMGLIK